MKSKGFTLIELLVVVAIISLLSSVVLASVRDARDKAQQSAYRSYLKEVVKGIELYRDTTNTVPGQTTGNSYLSWYTTTSLSSYIKHQADPSFITGTILRQRPSNYGYSCGQVAPASSNTAGQFQRLTDEPYIILITSNRTGLNLPRLYSTSGIFPGYYCVSLLAN